VKRYRSYLKKISAGILLIVLLFIHSVKLLHSHAYLPFCINHAAESSDREIAGSETVSIHPGDCVVCAYHLNKDSDAVTSFQHTVFYTYNPIRSALFLDSPNIAFLFVIETRGPPALV
jgi:hypothetical protein